MTDSVLTITARIESNDDGTASIYVEHQATGYSFIGGCYVSYTEGDEIKHKERYTKEFQRDHPNVNVRVKFTCTDTRKKQLELTAFQ